MEHSILIVDDERLILNSLRRLLNVLPYKFTFACNGNAGLESLIKHEYSVIISDMRMSELSGVELLKKAAEFQPDAFRMIMTGYADIDAAISAINDAKVDAYIAKPWNDDELKKEIINGIKKYEEKLSTKLEINNLRTENKQSTKELNILQELALTDQLTNLPNRRHFDEHYKQEWSRAIRNQSALSFLMIDIDNFKCFNDTMGHTEGDRILTEVALVLDKSLMRPGDFVARYGGEEFAAVLPEIKDLYNIAEFLRIAVKNVRVKNPAETENIEISISIGGSTCFPCEHIGRDFTDLIKIADSALYEAKNSGKDKVVIHEFR